MADEANTSRRAPVRRMASTMFPVPPTLMARDASRSFIGVTTKARWATTSHPSMAACTAGRSLTSAATNRTPGGSDFGGRRAMATMS